MNLSVNERENLWKLVKLFFFSNPNMKNSDLVNHSVNTSYARRTVYTTKNTIASANPKKYKKRTKQNGYE